MAGKKIEVSDSMLTADEGNLDFSLFENLDDDVIIKAPTLSSIPLLKLEQNMSPEVTDRQYAGKIFAGSIINDETKEVVGGTEEDTTVLTVRVLKSWRSRVKFPPRDSGVFGVECSCPSYHGVNSDEDWGTVYGACRKCMYSPYGVADGCRVQYNMLVCDANDPSVRYRLILAKTSYKGAQKFEDDWLEMATPIYRKQKKYPPYFTLPVKVFGKKVVDKKHSSSYYVYDLQVQPFTGMSKELVQGLVEAKESLQELYNAQIEWHKEQVENLKNAKAEAEPVADNAKEEAYTSLEDVFGDKSTTAEYDIPGGSEDIPF